MTLLEYILQSIFGILVTMAIGWIIGGPMLALIVGGVSLILAIICLLVQL